MFTHETFEKKEYILPEQYARYYGNESLIFTYYIKEVQVWKKAFYPVFSRDELVRSHTETRFGIFMVTGEGWHQGPKHLKLLESFKDYDKAFTLYKLLRNSDLETEKQENNLLESPE